MKNSKDRQNPRTSSHPEEQKTPRKAAPAKKKGLLLGAAALLVILSAGILVLQVLIPNSRYKAAATLAEAGKYDEAIAAFEALGDYKDSAALAKDAAYGAAGKLCQDGKFDEAIAAFEALGDYKDSAALAKDAAYGAAGKLYEAGRYEEAIAAFRALEGYRDADAQLEACYIGKLGEENYRQLQNIQVGDLYRFGAYEQDNDLSNGKEEIAWIVLEKEGMTLLLVSKYALDVRAFQDPYAEVTWESCTLRKWMNESFLNEAFDAEEQAAILDSTVTADPNPLYEVSSGSDTTDKVYIMSIPEAQRYFPTEQDRLCQGTAYCVARGARTDDEGNSWWLLRTPGYETRLAAFISSYGGISERGDGVNHERSAIRPVIRVNLLP